MSSTNMPFGFRPAFNPGGIIRPNEFPDAISSGFGTQIFIGQPVKLVGGFFQPITATTDKVYGVFAGAEWFASLNATTKSGATGWAAGGTYVAGTMRVWVHTDESIVYEVQAQGPVAQTSLGCQVTTTNINAGNVNIGQSGATVNNATVGAGNAGQWVIDSVQQGPDNGWSDNFTIVRVFNASNPIWPANTSIG